VSGNNARKVSGKGTVEKFNAAERGLID